MDLAIHVCDIVTVRDIFHAVKKAIVKVVRFFVDELGISDKSILETHGGLSPPDLSVGVSDAIKGDEAIC